MTQNYPPAIATLRRCGRACRRRGTDSAEATEAEAPVGLVGIDARDTATAKQEHERAAQADHRILILLLGMSIEEVFGLGSIRTAYVATTLNLIEHFLRSRLVVERDVVVGDLGLTFPVDREMIGCEVAVDVGIIALADLLPARVVIR